MESLSASCSHHASRPVPQDGAGDVKPLEEIITSHFYFTRIPAYTLVLEKHQKISQVGYIRKGTLHLLSTLSSGQACRKGLMGKGDFFGLELFFDRGVALYDALALNTVECHVIEPRDLVALLEEMPEFKKQLLAILTNTMERFFRNPALDGKPACQTSGHKENSGKFERTIAYIDAHYMKPLTLDDIARKAGLSRFYFSRTFKQETGHSFKDYLNIKRLEAAKKLLCLTEMNISQACYSAGFNDASYFARMFKRYEGKSPSAFRKEGLADNL